MLFMQSQQAWIIFMHMASPLVQVTMQPMSVISHLVMPIGMQQLQTIIPFIVIQQPSIPPAFIIIICCIIAAAVLSSHVQVIFIPPVIFSIFIMQRGIIMPEPGCIDIDGIIPFIMGIIPGIMPLFIIGIIIPICIIRSLVIEVMAFSVEGSLRGGTSAI